MGVACGWLGCGLPCIGTCMLTITFGGFLPRRRRLITHLQVQVHASDSTSADPPATRPTCKFVNSNGVLQLSVQLPLSQQPPPH